MVEDGDTHRQELQQIEGVFEGPKSTYSKYKVCQIALDI